MRGRDGQPRSAQATSPSPVRRPSRRTRRCRRNRRRPAAAAGHPGCLKRSRLVVTVNSPLRRNACEVSSASAPPGTRCSWAASSTRSRSWSSRSTWRTCPVMNARSKRRPSRRDPASAGCHVTTEAMSCCLAISSIAAASSTPVTSWPSSARRMASSPVPQPMSRNLFGRHFGEPHPEIGVRSDRVQASYRPTRCGPRTARRSRSRSSPTCGACRSGPTAEPVRCTG